MYQSQVADVGAGAVGVAARAARRRREAGAGRRRRRPGRRSSRQHVPVGEQQAEVGERVAERGHLPVQHRGDGRAVRVDEQVVEAVVAVHDRRPAPSRARVAASRSRSSSTPGRSRLRDGSSCAPQRRPAGRGSPRAGRSRPGPTAAGSTRVQVGEHVHQRVRPGRAPAASPSGVGLRAGPEHRRRRPAPSGRTARRARSSSAHSRSVARHRHGGVGRAREITRCSRPMSCAVASTCPSGGRRSTNGPARRRAPGRSGSTGRRR